MLITVKITVVLLRNLPPSDLLALRFLPEAEHSLAVTVDSKFSKERRGPIAYMTVERTLSQHKVVFQNLVPLTSPCVIGRQPTSLIEGMFAYMRSDQEEPDNQNTLYLNFRSHPP